MKNKLTLIIAFVVLTIAASAQTFEKPISSRRKKISVSVINLSDFPNGYDGINTYLANNLDTSLITLNDAPVGHYDVGVSYFIDMDGGISRLTIPINPGFGTAEEVKRVIREFHRHVPVLKLGRPTVFDAEQIIQFIVSYKDSLGENTKVSDQDLVVEKTNTDTSKFVFSGVQIEAEFPGGNKGWIMYLTRNLNQNIASAKGAPAGRYTVNTEFTIEKDGSVSDVRVINNPGYGTAEEAVRVLKKSPNWMPAIYKGHHVKYSAKQAITFIVGNG